MQRVMNIAEYILVIEKKILGQDGGWEHFVREKRKGRIDELKGTDFARWIVHSFWISLCVIDVIVITYVLFL